MSKTTPTLNKNFSIETILQLPRPQSAILNPNNTTLALWPSTQFNFKSGRTEKSISLIKTDRSSNNSLSSNEESNIEPTTSTLLEGLTYLDATWIDESSFLYLRPISNEVDQVKRGLDHSFNLSDKEQKVKLSELKKEVGEGIEIWCKDVTNDSEYKLGSLPVEISNLKIAQVKSKTEEGVILAFSASVFPDGDIFAVAANKKRVETESKGSDVRVYDSLMVRHWDTWKDEEIPQLFFIKLTKNPDSFNANRDEISEEDSSFEHVSNKIEDEFQEGKWNILSKTGKNLVRTIDVKSPMAETTLACPVGPFGGSSDFSISSTHLLFHAKDPLLNPAWKTRTQVYLVPLSPKNAADAKPKAITIGTQGACASPIFSVNGERIAWLEMRKDNNEADRHRVMIYEMNTGKSYGVTENWDRSPSEIIWCPCEQKIYLITEEDGRVKVFQQRVPIEKSSVELVPESLTSEHSVTSVSTISTSELLLTINSFTSPNYLSTLKIESSSPPTPNSPPVKTHLKLLSTLTPTLAKDYNLSKGESFAFIGNAPDVEVQGWILYPPGFEVEMAQDSTKKYPLAFIVHGGPESAFDDSFSTRWNLNWYAQQGFITVAINPTGSTGFGQDFTDGIQNSWGGKPFQDLVAGLNFVKAAYPIDPERMAMAGASYGGFMANWIQGHNDLMNFKCIICHDGVFSTANTWYSTEELYFPEQEFGGTPWEVPENYSKWNPQNFIKHWKTPQLVIHGGRDYRLTLSEGLGVFNTLQRLGIPSRFVYFEKENHWVLDPYNGVRWHEEVLKWMKEWTDIRS